MAPNEGTGAECATPQAPRGRGEPQTLSEYVKSSEFGVYSAIVVASTFSTTIPTYEFLDDFSICKIPALSHKPKALVGTTKRSVKHVALEKAHDISSVAPLTLSRGVPRQRRGIKVCLVDGASSR